VTMGRTFNIIAGLITLAACAFAAGLLAWRALRNSDDPWRLIFKWIVTGTLMGYLILGTLKSPVYAPIVAAILGVILGIMWAPHLGALIAKPFTSLYDGGDVAPEVRPFYSIAEAQRKKGKYNQAVVEVRKQLDRFPTDFQGWMLLADIYGGDLKDLNGAQSCVEELLRHDNHTPKNVSYALNRLADWNLSIAQDRDGAERALDWIIKLYPETEFSNQAAQRIARLTSSEMLAEKEDRPRIAVIRYEAKIGLVGESASPKPKEETPAEAAGRLVKHLDQHPLDTEAREELALVYANSYQRLDLAVDQLEQLIGSPNQPSKHVAHWLNTLADLHIRMNSDRASAVSALHRIIELFPGTAVAANAEKRGAYIDLELNKNKKSQAVRLGSYENNIGLKGQVPKI
jgi:tetratricopeptide (TPR) repeat protein